MIKPIPAPPPEDGVNQTGLLNGKTIVRFAHAFETGGGMERLLDDMDKVLLERNAMTVVRIYIASDPVKLEEREEAIGHGRLVWIPLALREGDSLQIAPDYEPKNKSLKERFRDKVLYHPLVWKCGLRKLILTRCLSRRQGQVVGAGAKIKELFNRYPVDLVMLHFFGGADADEIVIECNRNGVPFALENHYKNDRFSHLSIRKHAELACGVSGMNGLDVPKYLNRRFSNLADGIDTKFFQEKHASAPPGLTNTPVILLPARVVRPKGHWDLVQAAIRLKKNGHRFIVAFAGRVDSSRFVDELREEISHIGMEENFRFLGCLSVEELRDWYAASTVVAFPTYHHEGLGRVIIESQAMKTPVVAYATGGVPEGILDKQTGFLIPTGNVEILTEKLEELLNCDNRRIEMGKAGRAFVKENYSLQALATRHEQFYIKCMNTVQSSNANANTPCKPIPMANN